MTKTPKLLFTLSLLTVTPSLTTLYGCDDETSADPAPTADAGLSDAVVGGERDVEVPDAEVPDAMPEPRPYPDPGAWGPNTGPGGPAVAFEEDALYQNCAFVDVGPDDPTDHRNIVTMYDGYLLMPWSPEFGRTGGLTFFDISDPCNPMRVGHGTTELMRESHGIGFSHIGGKWAVTSHARQLRFGGILFWDISNIEEPTVAYAMELPGFFYPDAYARISFSNFWQAPYVYVGGADNGVWIVDATDPMNPVLVNQYVFDPILRAAQVQAIGNLLIVTSGEGTRTALLDISDPANPQPIPGGDFLNASGDGEPREIYFSTATDGYIYYARKEGGGGPLIYDIHDPSNPMFAGELVSDGNGGYAMVKDGFVFIGESRFAGLYDARDLDNITEVARMNLEGDLDTATPIGNVVFLAVDDKANDDEGTAVAPWQMMPDTEPPQVTWVWPPDNATDLPLTSRFGVTFSEHVDPGSAWAGSVRLYETGSDPALTRVDGHLSAQESIVNFWPVAPLKANTTYTFEITAGGVTDFNGNAVAETTAYTFTTGAR
ncbi:MAG: Ig-like domain-containing protein [Bradymonadia bacterium]